MPPDETPYSRLAVENIKEAIEGSADVQAFVAAHQSAFADFDTYLDGELIGKMMDLNVSKAEDTITQNIFGRVAPLPLIDKYQAYQLLDDKWNIISTDLEIIQTEGFAPQSRSTRIWSSKRKTIRKKKYRTAG